MPDSFLYHSHYRLKMYNEMVEQGELFVESKERDRVKAATFARAYGSQINSFYELSLNATGGYNA